MNLETWKNRTLTNYLKLHAPPEEEIKLVIKFLETHPSLKLARASYPDILKKAQLWQTKAFLPLEGETEVILTFKNGMKIIRLIDKKSKQEEGRMMNHCVGTYDLHPEIYSLRDSSNIPHCTIELNDKEVYQIKGPGNSLIAPQYIPYLIKFLNLKKIKIWDFLLKDLGYYRFSTYERKFLRNTFKNIKSVRVGRKLYFYSNNLLKLKAPPKSIPSIKVLEFILLRNNVKIITELLRASPKKKILVSALKISAKNNYYSIIDFLIRNFSFKEDDIFSALRWSIINNSTESVKLLLTKEITCPELKRKLLLKSIERSSPEIVKILLDLSPSLKCISYKNLVRCCVAGDPGAVFPLLINEGLDLKIFNSRVFSYLRIRGLKELAYKIQTIQENLSK